MSAYHIILRPLEQDVSVHHADSSCIDLIAEVDASSAFPIVWSDGEAVSLTVRCGGGPDIDLHISGLVSDNSLVLISGDLGMEILCPSASLERFYNLRFPKSGSIVEVSSESARLTLTVSLSGDQCADVDDYTHMVIAKNMRGDGSSINALTHPLTLTAVVLAFVSDWSDSCIDDLSEMMMQDMIYTEVG